MGWFRNKPATIEQVAALERKVDKLMATQNELLTQVRAQATKLTDVLTVVGKIKAETASVLKEVQDLKDAAANQDVNPELAAAIADVGTAADKLSGALDEVDAEVPDAATPVP